MYGESCPICALSAKYYKAEGKESKKGKYYWRDKKSLASVYVSHDPLPPNEETNENDQGKLKVAQLGNQLSSKYETRFKALLADDEIDDLPWSLENGLDFNIIKEKQGKYDKYDGLSDFARKATSLPKDFISSFEPVDLTKYLPANPGLEKVQLMLDAHLTGSEYVDESKSNKTENSNSESEKEDVVKPKTETKTTKSEKKVVQEQEEVRSEETSEDEDDDGDFLAKLRRRSAGKSE